MLRPEVKYAESGDLSIAYCQYGTGVDVVVVPGFVTHLDLMWDLPISKQFEDRGEYSRVVMFDKRGTGLSDRTVGLGSVEDRMDDIRAVMDAAGLERAALNGVSEGGPMAIMFAATYPERVTALTLFGTFARILEDEDYDGLSAADGEAFAASIESRWGSGDVISFFLQSEPGAVDPASLARYERSSCTPRMAAQLMRHNLAIDVREVLPVIDVPTLVLHHTGDPVVPVARARYLADHIPGARLVELPGDVHVGPESAAALPILAEFLTGERREAEPDRVLATVLFTDIVGSTERASALGDAHGARSSTVTTTSPAGRSRPAPVAPSSPRATASSRCSTGRRAPSGARRRWAGRSTVSGSRSAPACTPVSASFAATTSPGSRCTSARGSARSRARARCSCRRRCGI